VSASVNASGAELVEKLRAVGYQQIARSDGHFVLETDRNGTHRIVLPDRDRLCEHTVRSIMQDAGSHLGRKVAVRWTGGKPPPGGGSVVIYREGIGQVRQWFDKDGNRVKEELVTQPIDEAQPQRRCHPRDKKLQEWLGMMGYASLYEWPMPEWAWNAYAEMQRMYFPKLWNQFKTWDAFLNDPFQQGLRTGYQMALCVTTMDNATLLDRREPEAAIAARAERPLRVEIIERVCEEWSFPRQQKFFKGFTMALTEDAVYLETGKPTVDAGRFAVLRFLLDHRAEVKEKYMKKRQTIGDLYTWVSGDLESRCMELKTFQNLCSRIGLRLRSRKR
jgi:hypothetical protein